MTLRYGSVCSGVEAATLAWEPLGWTPSFFAEIEKFPRAVLQSRWPNVPLHGDFTTIKQGDYDPIDVLVGGTPCQDFSVAGLRKGIAGDRGNLTLQFVGLLDRLRPRWFLLENVPGLMSLSGGDVLRYILDEFQRLGYIVDIDKLDAQWFGLAQRRERIFICGQHVDDLLQQRTDSSALTIAQALLETLHAILAVHIRASQKGPASSASAHLTASGAQQRIALFGFLSGSERSPMWQENLADALQRCRRAPESSGSGNGGNDPASMQDGQSMDSGRVGLSIPTAELLKKRLVESCGVVKSFITSTQTSRTTNQQIYTCSQAALCIVALIGQLNDSSPPFWSAACSALTCLREFISYARSTSSDLFGDMERVQPWRDFIEQAEPASIAIGNIGVPSFGKIFPISESLSGNPAPRREAGQRVAGTLDARADAGGFPGTDGSCDGHVVPVAAYGGNNSKGAIDVATARNEHSGPSGRLDFESETFIATAHVAPSLRAQAQAQASHRADSDVYIAHALRADGFDASEDGTRRGSPPVASRVVGFNGRQDICPAAVSGALDEDAYSQCVAFDTTQITSAENRSQPKSGDPSHPLTAHGHAPCIAFSAKDHGADAASDVSPTLRVGGHDKSHANAGVMPAVAFPIIADAMRDSSSAVTPSADAAGRVRLRDPGLGIGQDGDPMFTLQATQPHAVVTRWAVRRLMPVECEKLQGQPPGHTLVDYRGKPAADGPRYKSIGNSFPVPVIRRIGERIAMVDKL